jgi:predicted glycosyltransferase
MNILIDIGHPAHVHYYRNLANDLLKEGHNVVFSVKDIDIVKKLMEFYGFSYSILPHKRDSLLGKVVRQMQYNWKLLRICQREKIDIAIGSSVSVVHVSKISPVKSIIFDDDDDEVQPLVTKYVNPFADIILSPDSLRGKRSRTDTVYYPGGQELAYLHPNRFQPSPEVLNEVGLEEGERFFVMRFNVFKAHHDVGINGLSLRQKLSLIEFLEPYGRIFITTEREIEPELQKYQLNISPEKIHSLMAYATMFLGDSQTMSSEAAVLGVPSLRCNSFAGRISYLEEWEKRYGLAYAYLPEDFDKLMQKLRELILLKDLKEEWRRKREKMLKNKIDVTAFWLWFITNFPESKEMVKNDTNFWSKFR